MAKFDLTAFGESMIRFSPPIGETLETATRFDVHVAGAEGNVLCALAQLGFSCGWLGALPDSPLGRRVQRAYQSCGVSVQAVKSKSRIGLYYLQQGQSPFPSTIIYDRWRSAAAQMHHNYFDSDFMLDTRAIHLSGITPALSVHNHGMVQNLIERAKELNIIVGFDVNYRQLLWDANTAREVLLPLISEVDIVFCSRRDAVKVFACEGEIEDAITQLAHITKVQHIVMSDGSNGACVYDAGQTKQYAAPAVRIIDRVGCGDALAAGVWYGLLSHNNFADGMHSGVQLGITLAARALTQVGDIVTISLDDISTTLSDDIIR